MAINIPYTSSFEGGKQNTSLAASPEDKLNTKNMLKSFLGRKIQH